MVFLEHTKKLETFMQVLLRNPGRYMPLVELRDSMTLSMDELTWAECERIGAAISEDNGSEFCAGVRLGIAEALGESSNAISYSKLKPIFDFALKLNRDVSSITESDIQPVRDAGWSDQTVEDVIGLVAMTNAYNILAKGLGFSGVPHEKFKQLGETTVNKQGYKPLYVSFLELPQQN